MCVCEERKIARVCVRMRTCDWLCLFCVCVDDNGEGRQYVTMSEVN